MSLQFNFVQPANALLALVTYSVRETYSPVGVCLPLSRALSCPPLCHTRVRACTHVSTCLKAASERSGITHTGSGQCGGCKRRCAVGQAGGGSAALSRTCHRVTADTLTAGHVARGRIVALLIYFTMSSPNKSLDKRLVPYPPVRLWTINELIVAQFLDMIFFALIFIYDGVI